MSAPATQRPFCFNSSKVCTTLPMRATGTYSKALAEVLATIEDNGQLRCLGIKIP